MADGIRRFRCPSTLDVDSTEQTTPRMTQRVRRIGRGLALGQVGIREAYDVIALDHAATQLRIELGGQLGREYLLERRAGRDALPHAVADRCEHVTIRDERRAIARDAMARDDARAVVDEREHALDTRDDTGE